MTTTKPVRLRLSRRKGFNLQKLSLETNGLQAVNCARPGRYGNPFKTHPGYSVNQAISDFRLHVKVAWPWDKLDPLHGKNLACFCGLDQPCHCDVLLELANSPPPSPKDAK